MLRFIFGRSKSGKTTYVDNKVCDLINEGEERILVIVPDQVTFETEKAYLNLLGPKLSTKVMVLGFSRLCDYVFEFTGAVRKTPADDCTKALLMSVALEEVKDNLSLYCEKANSPELAKLMLSARKELNLSGNTYDSVFEAIADTDELTKNKMGDIYLASSAMEALLSESFEDPDAELSIVAELIRIRPVFEDYHIFIDSYLSFTAPEIEVITELLKQCKDMYVTLSYDGVSKEGIFSISRDTASKLKRIAQSENVSLAEPVLCTYNGFYSSADLLHIEENVFMPYKEKYCEKADNVTLYRAKNRFDEVDFVAREIRKLIIDEGYRYSDIAVVGRDMGNYASIIPDIFDKYEISYFADKPHDITSKPLIKVISGVFNAINGGFDKDDILSLLKTGLTSVNDEDIALFENYVYTWQINYSSFFKEFTANPRGFADELTFDDLTSLKRIENVRLRIVEPLVNFRRNYSDSEALEISKGLYNLLLDLGTDRKILELSEKLENLDKLADSREQIRLWEILADTLDRTSEVIGKRNMSLKRFSELLMLQFSMTDISFIPKALDQITVGDIERLRLGGRKAVFVIGAVEGIFPKSLSNSGIFTLAERSELSRLNILDEADDRHNADRELYLAYYALTSASDKLFVSYPSAELNGEILSHSAIISELLDVLSEVNFRMRSTDDTSELLWAKKPAYEFYAEKARSKDTLTLSLKKYFSEDADFSHKLTALDSVINSKDKFKIKDIAVAEKLFGKNMHLSASKIEKYHQCRFAYFCQYGLKLNERKKASIDSLEYGSFVHYILENFFKTFTKAELTSLSDEKIEGIINDVSDVYANTHFGGLMGKSNRFVYLFNGVKEASVTLVKHLIEELNQSEFAPADFELDIGKDISAYRLNISDGFSVTVTGKVDRADIMEKDGKSYIRIVDYKTGTKKFNLSDVMYGLNLQMLLYLSVIDRYGNERYKGEIVPSGVLYMPAFVSPLEMAVDSNTEDIAKELNSSLKMNGILLDDISVLKAMEQGLSGVYIPVATSSKGTLKGKDNLATLEEFGAIFAHIDKLIGEMAQELINGKIDATPATTAYDPCSYCAFDTVCSGRDKNSLRYIVKLDRQQILDELGINKEEVTE